jgi:hypothetical protein
MIAPSVFIFLVLSVFWPGRALWAQAAFPADASSNKAVAAVPALAQPVGAEEAVPESEDELFVRDPFLTWIPSKIALMGEQSFGSSSGAGPQEIVFDPDVYKVAGIVWGIEKARAIINGEILGVGDKVLDADILKIDKEGIVLLFHEKEYLLARGMIDGKVSGEGIQ